MTIFCDKMAVLLRGQPKGDHFYRKFHRSSQDSEVGQRKGLEIVQKGETNFIKLKFQFSVDEERCSLLQ